MNEAKMTELTQAEEMAYFRADLCLYSPESYTLDEKKEICNEMMATSKAIQDAMRADFEQLPPDARAKLIDMLCASGVASDDWWWDVLARGLWVRSLNARAFSLKTCRRHVFITLETWAMETRSTASSNR